MTIATNTTHAVPADRQERNYHDRKHREHGVVRPFGPVRRAGQPGPSGHRKMTTSLRGRNPPTRLVRVRTVECNHVEANLWLVGLAFVFSIVEAKAEPDDPETRTRTNPDDPG